MLLLKDITNSSKDYNKSFIVIGGIAVAAHGYSRLTGDIDLLVPKSDSNFWKKLVENMGYEPIQVNSFFARYKLPENRSWPIDFMFVGTDVFQEMLSEATDTDIGDTSVKIPSIRHLIALKLPALKQRQEHREDKDCLDVKNLIRLGNISDSELRQLCKKYDRMDLYEKLKKSN